MSKRKFLSPLMWVTAVGIGLFLSSSIYAADDSSPGAKIFQSQDCTGCHGPKGEGIEGLAPPLKGSKFVLTASEADIAHTIKFGRSGSEKHFPNLPQSMPSHPNLSDQQLQELVAYLKSGLQK
jgi:mono/diheme cytochrome c family protein